MDWQPIEEAPKDGVTVLGYSSAIGILVMRWREGYVSYELGSGGEIECFKSGWGVIWPTGILIPEPTHFMPLPEPPNT